MELMRRGSETHPEEEEIFSEEVSEEEEEFNSELEFDVETEKVSYDYILSNRVLLWAPYDAQWGDTDETESIKELVKNSPYNLSLDIVDNSKANINSLSNLSRYGVIIFATHGFEGQWIATGEEYTGETKKYADFLQEKEVSVAIMGNVSKNTVESKYLVSHRFLRNRNQKKLPNSVIINNSCSSLSTEDFYNTLKDMGAATYYGYSGQVTNEYVVLETEDLLTKLFYEQSTTGDSYEYSYDWEYGGEYFGIKGVSNLVMPLGLINSGFEDGLSGWNTSGDARAISQLGSLRPTEGKYMAIVSTGLGFEHSKGEISREFYIPEDATTMSLDWNFLSEEFIEFIDSSFDDSFEISVTLTNESNSKVTLLRKSVNSIAKDFNANRTSPGKLKHVSPEICFDEGDVWMTDWQSSSVDISKYAGQNVTLSFSIKDTTDIWYSTAVLIDNISFDCGNLTSDGKQYVAQSFSEQAIRSMYKQKDTLGRSYIFFNGDDFSKQAEKVRERTKLANGYASINQVIMKNIKTEKRFTAEWENMTSNKSTREIDDVVLLFHGSYYAIMINEDLDENHENLTTAPSKKVSTEDDATYIRNLKKKKIDCITIMTCNGGLLDGINLDASIPFNVQNLGKRTFTIKGNVAQAFLDSQNVREVKAWDGSLSYLPYSYVPILAKSQVHYLEKIKKLKKYRCYKPKRGIYFIGLFKKHIKKNQPKGQVIYIRTKKGNMYCLYSYLTVTNPGSILVRKRVKVKLKDFS